MSFTDFFSVLSKLGSFHVFVTIVAYIFCCQYKEGIGFMQMLEIMIFLNIPLRSLYPWVPDIFLVVWVWESCARGQQLHTYNRHIILTHRYISSNPWVLIRLFSNKYKTQFKKNNAMKITFKQDQKVSEASS